MGVCYDMDACIETYLKGEGFHVPPVSVDETLSLTVELVQKVPVSPTAYVFVFAYPPEVDEAFKCHTFTHFTLHGVHPEPLLEGHWNNTKAAFSEGLKVTKKYTPIFIDHAKREVHFLIRIYRCCEKFPDGGRFTRFAEQLKLHDKLVIQPMQSRVTLPKTGLIKGFNGEVPFETLNIIAGGTGITPYVRFIVNNTASKVRLLFCNKTLKEILLKPLFDEVEKRGLLKVKYLVTSEDPAVVDAYQRADGDNVFFAKLTLEQVEPFFEKENSCTLFCGPPGMNTTAGRILGELGLG